MYRVVLLLYLKHDGIVDADYVDADYDDADYDDAGMRMQQLKNRQRGSARGVPVLALDACSCIMVALSTMEEGSSLFLLFDVAWIACLEQILYGILIINTSYDGVSTGTKYNTIQYNSAVAVCNSMIVLKVYINIITIITTLLVCELEIL